MTWFFCCPCGVSMQLPILSAALMLGEHRGHETEGAMIFMPLDAYQRTVKNMLTAAECVIR